MPPELFPIDHPTFVADVRAVAAALAAGAWVPDRLVGIGRGGLVPGVYLSHATGIPLLAIDHGVEPPRAGAELAARTGAGERLLLVDDINDSGGTIVALRTAILAAGIAPACLRTAVLLDNLRSATRVDYAARTIDRATDKRWFVFPWEALAPRETLLAESEEVPARLASPVPPMV